MTEALNLTSSSCPTSDSVCVFQCVCVWCMHAHKRIHRYHTAYPIRPHQTHLPVLWSLVRSEADSVQPLLIWHQHQFADVNRHHVRVWLCAAYTGHIKTC